MYVSALFLPVESKYLLHPVTSILWQDRLHTFLLVAHHTEGKQSTTLLHAYDRLSYIIIV